MSKKHLLMLLLLSLSFGMTMAQDVIVKKDGSTILSKVLEIGGIEIKYKKWSNQDGPTYTIPRSEILSINYQNGEVDSFYDNNSSSQETVASDLDLPIYVKGELKHVRRKILTLDGKVLSDDESQRLLGTKAYEDFLKGAKLGRIGDFITLPGVLCVVGGACLLILPVALSENQGVESSDVSIIGTSGLFCLMIGGSMVIAGSIVSSTGKRMIRNVVEEYNRNNKKNISFNFSPSIIQTNTPQSQGNIGLGMTFSMNF